MKKFLLIAVILLFITNIGALRAASSEEMKIGGDIGIGMPMGNSSNVANTGFGLNAVFSYFLNPQLVLTGTIGYWSFGVPSGYSSFSVMPINGGIQYRFNRGKVQPFIGAETLFYTITYSSGKDYYGNSYSISETDFGFTPQFGLAFPMENNIEVRAAMKYHIIFTSGSNSTFLGIMGGVHFKI